MDKTKKLKIGLTEAQQLKSIVTTEGKALTETERRQLEQKCNDRLNWSDGGHWIGSGPEPNCFQRSVMTGGVTLLYEFPTDESAFKWNAEWEKAIRYAGHLATAVVTTIVTLKTGGIAGIAVGTIAAVVKDELQARVTYPKVARGWKYLFSINHTFQWSPHPWGKNSFYQEASGTSFDHQGKQQYRSINRVELDLDTFPESLAIDLASMPGKTVTIIYR